MTRELRGSVFETRVLNVCLYLLWFLLLFLAALFLLDLFFGSSSTCPVSGVLFGTVSIDFGHASNKNTEKEQ